MSSSPAPSSSTGSAAGAGSSKPAGGGIQIGFLLEFAGAAAVIAAAFFSPLPERIAVLSGAAAFAAGRFFPRISK